MFMLFEPIVCCDWRDANEGQTLNKPNLICQSFVQFCK